MELKYQIFSLILVYLLPKGSKIEQNGRVGETLGRL